MLADETVLVLACIPEISISTKMGHGKSSLPLHCLPPYSYGASSVPVHTLATHRPISVISLLPPSALSLLHLVPVIAHPSLTQATLRVRI